MKRYLVALSLMLLEACSTPGQVARIDKDKRRFELQSQDDSKSALSLNNDTTTAKLAQGFEKRIAEQPRDLDAHINLAQTYLARSEYDKAEATCRNALRIDLKSETARKILAQIYYRRGNLEMAQIILNGIDAFHSKDSQVLNLLGMIALRQERPEYALLSFQEALKHNPSDTAVRMNLGVLYVHYRQLGLASIEFERILKVMPEHPDANLNMAIIEANRSNLDRAETLYKKVLNVSKGNPVATYNLALLEEKRKNYDKALDYLKSYIESDYAKKRNNQEVFALIDKVRLEKEALTGERVSDKEIMSLAAKAQKKSLLPNNSSSNDKEFVDAEPRIRDGDQKPEPAPREKAKPLTAVQEDAKQPKVNSKAESKPKEYRNEKEEIDDLENQLK